jgi:hypothetical protein
MPDAYAKTSLRWPTNDQIEEVPIHRIDGKEPATGPKWHAPIVVNVK